MSDKSEPSQKKAQNQSQNQPPANPGKPGEYEFYEACIDHMVTITYLDGSTLTGTLRAYTKYELFIQGDPAMFPLLVCKHAIRSIER